MADSCCVKKKNVLLYACSGAANVAEVADRAARELMAEEVGPMFCLAGVAAGIQGMVQTARDADLNVLIDGCPMECARKVFERAGLPNYVQIKVTDLGIEKKKGVRAADEEVRAVKVKVRKTLQDV